MNKTIEEIKSSISFVCSQYDDLNKILNEKIHIVDALKIENDDLRSEVSKMNLKMESIEQQLRSSNLEIQCMPEHKNENLLNIINQMAKIVSYDLKESEIANYHRVPKLNKDSKRPRAIVVKFTSPRVRDNILASIKKFNKEHPQEKLNSAHLGFTGSKQAVYVEEHLSPVNKKFHATARAVAKEKQYKFVWIRGGKVFIRKDINSRSILVNSVTLNTL